jgi:hypothetical protein
MTKTPQTLVRDIYKLLETKEIPPEVSLEAQCEAFGKAMGTLLLEQLQPEEDRSGRLRLSAIGKPDRQIYNRYHGIKGEDLKGATYLKFLYGHVVEALILALVEISGHKVTDQQKECYVEGVKGHMDGRIDGVVMDVKSCSSFGFKKFVKGTLHESDDFGYIAQLKAYAHSEGETTYGWLAFDKQNGGLAWLQYDESHTQAQYFSAVDYDIAQRVRDVKKLVLSAFPPQHCFSPVPDGKSGNERLDTGCSYCDFKHHCYPDLQTYFYASGPKYLTKVEREPNVRSYPKEF